jgi:hypothetical protein
MQQEEKAEIIYSQNDLSQIYSLALDSLLGPPERWTDSEPLIVNDSIVLRVTYHEYHDTNGFETDLLSEERYCGRGMNCLQKYQGFNQKEFVKIVRDKTWQLNKYNGSLTLSSSYKYKPINNVKPQESYDPGDPLAAIKFEKVAFSENGEYALAIVSFYKAPEWGKGVAYFLKKNDGRWEIVGQNQLFVS